MLRCVSPYKADTLRFEVGEVIDNPKLEAHLLTDSPASFEVVGAVKAAQAPEVKAVLEAPASKAVKRGK